MGRGKDVAGSKLYAILRAAATAAHPGVERIGDVLRHLAGGDQNDVEPNLLLHVGGIAPEPKLGGGDDPAFSPFGHGFDGVIGARAL